MGFKRGALLGPLELLQLDQSADFCLQNKPQWCVCSKPGALSAGFPAADTLEKMSASGFFLASFFGTPAVGRPCCWAQGEMLTLSWGKPPYLSFSGGRSPSCGLTRVKLLYVSDQRSTV